MVTILGKRKVDKAIYATLCLIICWHSFASLSFPKSGTSSSFSSPEDTSVPEQKIQRTHSNTERASGETSSKIQTISSEDDLNPFARSNSSTQASSRLPLRWIHVRGFAEGFSGWRDSISELLLLSKAMSACFVLPCMSNGRLKSCQGTPVQERISISRIFDLSLLSTIDWREHSEFENWLSLKHSEAIVHKNICFTKTYKDYVSVSCGNSSNYYHARSIPELESNFDVLEVPYFWRTALQNLRLSYPGSEMQPISTPIATLSRVREMQRNLPFKKEHYDKVKTILNRSSIHVDSFTLLHWRAEKANLDYLRCAEVISQIRQAMDVGKNSTFLLMSSLNNNESLMWAGSRNMAKGSNANEALQLLQERGFTIFDTLLGEGERPQDPGFLAVYDLILAEKAKVFTACGQGCASKKVCTDCNHLGKFATLALALRYQKGRNDTTTYPCWPSPSVGYFPA